MQIEIVKASPGDKSDIISLIDEAKGFLKANGVDQWQDGYPDEEVILKDISGDAYVLKCDGVTSAYFYLADREETYDKIYFGDWLTGKEEKYIAIHRIAVKNGLRGRGFAGLIYGLAAQIARQRGKYSLRIDTHEDNSAMRRSLERAGFVRCGKIYLVGGSERLAYEKII